MAGPLQIETEQEPGPAAQISARDTLPYRGPTPTRWGHEVSSVNATAADAKVRGYLWVDAVGGFLVCLNDRVVIGQPEPHKAGQAGAVDVAIWGDLSARHATLVRDREGYTIEPRRPVRINGLETESIQELGDQNELELGRGVRFEFRVPHPLSLSARLEPRGGQRFAPSVDGVLLWADTLIIGPAPTSHVVAPRWEHEVVCYRAGAQWWVKCPAGLSVNGQPTSPRQSLPPAATVDTPDGRLRWEF